MHIPKTAEDFSIELSLRQPEPCEISLIKVVTDIPFIRHFILAWPWVFFIIMAHIIHSSSLIKIMLSIFFLLSPIICKKKEKKKYTYLCVWQWPSSGLITTGLYITQFNFSDELRKVLIAFGFAFYKAESFPTD